MCARNILVVLVVLIGSVNIAAASDDDYFGVQYSSLIYEDTSLGESLEFKPTALVARMGSFINRYLAIEARLGLGFSDDEITTTGTNTLLGAYDGNIGYDINSIFGVYAVGNLPVTDRFDLYGLIGYSSVDAEISFGLSTTKFGVSNLSGNDTENGLSYGFGGSVGVMENMSLNLEYMSYLDKDEFVLESINLGVLFNY